MGLIRSVALSFFAIAMVAFGIQHLVYGEFVTRVVPKLPAWIPSHSFLAYMTGSVLIAAGVAILFHKQARPASLLLGSLILLSVFVFYLPLLLATTAFQWTLDYCGQGTCLVGRRLSGS
jgi:uncharacterized membrane protein